MYHLLTLWVYHNRQLDVNTPPLFCAFSTFWINFLINLWIKQKIFVNCRYSQKSITIPFSNNNLSRVISLYRCSGRTDMVFAHLLRPVYKKQLGINRVAGWRWPSFYIGWRWCLWNISILKTLWLLECLFWHCWHSFIWYVASLT